jgi:hypothetical protein
MVVPFYPYWSIFDKEGDTFKSELTCFWNIANLLSATTGTVEFLEKAIERWETVDVPQCIGLQTKDERTQEIFKATRYTNSPAYRNSWEQWIQAAAPASKALEFLAKNGLFNKMYEDQQKERWNKEFQKEFKSPLNIFYLDTEILLVNEFPTSLRNEGGDYLYTDSTHVSRFGAEIIVKNLP